MKIQITQRLLFFLVLFGIGFAAVALSFDASPTQVHRPTQLGYGHAPDPTQGAIQADKQTQLGFGHTPHLPLDEAQAHRPIQLGFGHAPSPTQGSIQGDKQTYR